MLRIDWTEEEFQLLGDTILSTVREGGTVLDACRKFEEMTGGKRSAAAARYKFQVKVLPRIRDEYERAKLEGAMRQAEMRQQEAQRVEEDDGNEKTMTQRDLLRLLRSVRIVDDESNTLRWQVEHLQQQVEQLTQERDQLKRELDELRTKYAEVESERDKLIEAFQIARRAVAGAPDKATIKIGADGVVQSVETDH